MVTPTEWENSLTARNGGPTWPEDRFLSPFVHMRREMAHPGMTKGFLQLSPEAAMLPGPRVETRPPPPVPPFKLSHKEDHDGRKYVTTICWAAVGLWLLIIH